MCRAEGGKSKRQKCSWTELRPDGPLMLIKYVRKKRLRVVCAVLNMSWHWRLLPLIYMWRQINAWSKTTSRNRLVFFWIETLWFYICYFIFVSLNLMSVTFCTGLKQTSEPAMCQWNTDPRLFDWSYSPCIKTQRENRSDSEIRLLTEKRLLSLSLSFPLFLSLSVCQ